MIAMARGQSLVGPLHNNGRSSIPEAPAEMGVGGKQTADSTRAPANPSKGPAAWRTTLPYRRASGRRGAMLAGRCAPPPRDGIDARSKWQQQRHGLQAWDGVDISFAFLSAVGTRG